MTRPPLRRAAQAAVLAAACGSDTGTDPAIAAIAGQNAVTAGARPA